MAEKLEPFSKKTTFPRGEIHENPRPFAKTTVPQGAICEKPRTVAKVPFPRKGGVRRPEKGPERAIFILAVNREFSGGPGPDFGKMAEKGRFSESSRKRADRRAKFAKAPGFSQSRGAKPCEKGPFGQVRPRKLRKLQVFRDVATRNLVKMGFFCKAALGHDKSFRVLTCPLAKPLENWALWPGRHLTFANASGFARCACAKSLETVLFAARKPTNVARALTCLRSLRKMCILLGQSASAGEGAPNVAGRAEESYHIG